MKQETERLYLCDEGKVFIRKADGFIMGDGIDLGDEDTIDNYEEVDDPTLDSDADSDVESISE